MATFTGTLPSSLTSPSFSHDYEIHSDIFESTNRTLKRTIYTAKMDVERRIQLILAHFFSIGCPDTGDPKSFRITPRVIRISVGSNKISTASGYKITYDTKIRVWGFC